MLQAFRHYGGRTPAGSLPLGFTIYVFAGYLLSCRNAWKHWLGPKQRGFGGNEPVVCLFVLFVHQPFCLSFCFLFLFENLCLVFFLGGEWNPERSHGEGGGGGWGLEARRWFLPNFAEEIFTILLKALSLASHS